MLACHKNCLCLCVCLHVCALAFVCVCVCCVVLCCSVLCCVALCCVVLCCVLLFGVVCGVWCVVCGVLSVRLCIFASASLYVLVYVHVRPSLLCVWVRLVVYVWRLFTNHLKLHRETKRERERERYTHTHIHTHKQSKPVCQLVGIISDSNFSSTVLQDDLSTT